MTTPWLAPLARWTADLRFADLACDMELRLFTVMSDWASAALAGMGHPLYEKYVAGLLPFGDERGPASVLGQRFRRPIAQAAAANAAIGHFWEVDDAHRQSTSHPGITVVPVVVALAEAFPDTPVDRAREAVIVGYEAGLRIGSFLGKDHYAVCHTTATAGTFGAAAAAAHMLGLDRDQTLSAFGHAGTQAQGLWQLLDDGAAESKGFHAAIAVRNGIAAAAMAKAGLQGATRILEGRRGMLEAWKLTGGAPGWLVPDGAMMIDTVTVKNWPTCGQMHSALDCAEAVHAAAPAPVCDIARVSVDVPGACLDIASVTRPETLAEAKFSTAFCIAAVLAGKRPDFRGLTEALVKDPEIQSLAARIEVRADPAFSARFPEERPARVTRTLQDGTEQVQERSFRRGDPEAGWSRAELVERTRDVLSLASQPVHADRLLAWCGVFADPTSKRWPASDLFTFALSSRQPVLEGAS